MKTTIRRTITIQWDGTPQEYIALATKLSVERTGYALDSLDCGDATGFFADMTDDIDDTIWWTRPDGTLLGLRREYADENYEYDLPHEETNVTLTLDEAHKLIHPRANSSDDCPDCADELR